MATAAIVTIKGARRMSVAGRRRIAKWLRDHAKFLELYGKEYNETFRGRYIYGTTRNRKKEKTTSLHRRS